jgi:AcrR family transcriptional regulator
MTTTKTEVQPEEAAVPRERERGRGRPQARSDEETRAVIYEAARHEFAASGYAATNVESVARSAGVSTKTVYRLIPNKAALFEAMITERIERFASVVRLRACEGGDIEAALRDALMVCGELILDADVIALQQMILSDSDKFPDIAETFYHKAITPTQDTLASWLRAQQKRGLLAIDDADAAAGMLLGMLAMQPQRAVMFGHASAPTRAELEQRVEACAKLFLKGCGRRP